MGKNLISQELRKEILSGKIKQLRIPVPRTGGSWEWINNIFKPQYVEITSKDIFTKVVGCLNNGELEFDFSLGNCFSISEREAMDEGLDSKTFGLTRSYRVYGDYFDGINTWTPNLQDAYKSLWRHRWGKSWRNNSQCVIIRFNKTPLAKIIKH
jgi:hypothetical protein